MTHFRFKNLFAVLTAAMMALCAVSGSFTEIYAQAAVSADVQDDTAVSGTGSLGGLIADKLTAEQSALEAQNGCRIMDVQIEDGRCYVSFQTTRSCTLLLTFCDEKTGTVRFSQTAEVMAEDTELYLALEGTIPDFFVLQCCLIDTVTSAPLSAVYSSELYTQAMQEFLSKTTADFDADRVIDLDGDADSNFLVFSGSTVLLDSGENVNTVLSADDTAKHYVIGNISEEAAALKPGDVFVLGSDNEMIITKIAKITVDGTTADITGTETDLETVFDYVRIEPTAEDMQVDEDSIQAPDEDTTLEVIDSGAADAFFQSVSSKQQAQNFPWPIPDEISVDGTTADNTGTETDLETVFDYVRIEPTAEDMQVDEDSIQAPDEDTTLEVIDSGAADAFFQSVSSKQQAQNFPWPIPDEISVGGEICFKMNFAGDNTAEQKEKKTEKAFTLSGDLYVKIAPALKIIIVPDHQYVKLNITTKIGFKLTAKLSGELEHALTAEPIGVTFFGIVNFGISPKLVLEGEISVTLTGSITFENGVEFDSDRTDEKVQQYWKKPVADFGLEIEGKLFVGLRAPITLNVVSDDVASISLGAYAGVELNLKQSISLNDMEEVAEEALLGQKRQTEHDCLSCFEGDLNFVLGLEFKATFLKLDYATIKRKFAELKIKISDLYFSVTHKEFGFCTCPHHLRQVTFHVYDLYDEPVSDVWVETDSGTAVSTAEDGSVTVLLNDRLHSYRVYDAPEEGEPRFKEFSDYVSVRGMNRTVTVTLAPKDSDYLSGYRVCNYNTPLYDVDATRAVPMLSASGEPDEEGCILLSGLYYKIYDDHAAVCGYPSGDDMAKELREHITVYAEVNGLPVTEIEDRALSGYPGLLSVRVPDSVKKLGESAFAYLTKIQSIQLPAAITEYPAYLFRGSGMESRYIPDTVTRIGRGAFAECRNLKSVRLPVHLTVIPAECFRECRALAAVEIPASVSEIDDRAFYESGLSRLDIPPTVQVIGELAFAQTQLDAVTLPDTEISIDYRGKLFYGCKRLKRLTVPDALCGDLDALTRGLNDFTLTAATGRTDSNSTWIGNYLDDSFVSNPFTLKIPDGTRVIEAEAFEGQISIESLIIPEGVTEIGSNAFARCIGLKTVILPESLTKIGSRAFSGCTALQYITLPDNLKTIGTEAFSDCTSLKEIVIPEKTQLLSDSGYFGRYFAGCTMLESVAMQQDLSYSELAANFADTPYLESIRTETEDGNVMYIRNGVLLYAKCGGHLTIPEGVTRIADNAVAGQPLETVSLPSSLLEIGNDAFYSSELTAVTIPESVISIGDEAFACCNSLESVRLPASLHYVGDGAFSYTPVLEALCGNEDEDYAAVIDGVLLELNCVSGDTVVVPDGVYLVSCYCMIQDADRFSAVSIPDSVQWVNCFYTDFFGDNQKLMDAFCEANIKGTHRFDYAGWVFSADYTIPDGVTVIGESVFYENSYIESVVIPEGVTEIEDFAFAECKYLKSVQLPQSLRHIGKGAFYGCSALTGIQIPENVQEIEADAFLGCSLLSDAALPAHLTEKETVQETFQSHPELFIHRNGSETTLVIPEGVTCIEKLSLNNSYEDIPITRIEFPESLEVIGNNAFDGFEALRTVVFPANSRLRTIDHHAFSYCTSLYSVYLPDSLQKIGKGAFAHCSALKTVKLPDRLTKIDSGAFSRCTALAHITLPDSLIQLGSGVFQGCTALKNVHLPEQLPYLSRSLFSGCTSLTEITLPENLRRIEDAFQGCTALTELRIPQNVVTIRYDALENCKSLKALTLPPLLKDAPYVYSCTSLTEILVPEDAQYLCSMNGVLYSRDQTTLIACPPAFPYQEYTIPETVTSITEGFQNCKALMAVHFPDELTAISERAFYGTVFDTVTTAEDFDREEHLIIADNVLITVPFSTESYTVPGGIRAIADYAFASRQNLRSVTIPSSVTRIGSCAFSDCPALSALTIPDSVRTLGYHVFSSCGKLEDLHIYRKNADQNEDLKEVGSPFTLHLTDGITEIPNSALSRQQYLKAAVLPETVTAIGKYAFSDSPLQQINLSSGLTSIGDSAFADTKIMEITLPDTLTELGDDAFKGSALQSISVPGSVSVISEYAFSGTPLSSVTLEEGVTEIKRYAFHGCDMLHTLNLPATLTDIGASAFYDCKGMVSLTLPKGIRSFGQNAFYGCSSITELSVSEGVTEIGEGAFSFFTNVTAIHLPDTLKIIGNKAFAGCESLTEIEIPDGVTEIGNSAFEKCKKLASVSLPDTLQTIGSYAFNSCGLRSVTLPENITLGYSAFGYNTLLSCVTLPVTVTKCSNNPFESCGVLTDIYYSGSEIEWENCPLYRYFKSYSVHFGETAPTTEIVHSTQGVIYKAYQDYAAVTGYSGSAPTVEILSEYEGKPVKIIEQGFTENRTLTAVYLPDTLTRIFSDAFSSCTSLKRIYFPANSCVEIYGGAFAGCTNLSELNIPNAVIRENAFDKCSNLEVITLISGSVEKDAFSGCTEIKSVTLGGGAGNVDVDAEVFANQRYLETVCLLEGVSLIGKEAFAACNMSTLTLPKSLLAVGTHAFSECSRLTSVQINGRADGFEAGVFLNCQHLYTASFAEGTQLIPEGIFMYCRNLNTVTVPASVTAIDSFAFGDCSSLSQIRFGGTAEDFADIEIRDGNEPFTRASVKYPDTQAELRPAVFTADEEAITAPTPSDASAEEPRTVSENDRVQKRRFTGLVPHEIYNFYAVGDWNQGINAGELYCFTQKTADENGVLEFTFTLPEYAETCDAVVVRAMHDLSGAELTVQSFAEDGTLHAQHPVVTYNGITLKEGADYIVNGDYAVSEAGFYTVGIEGIGLYFGTASADFAVIAPNERTLAGDVNLSGDLSVADAVLLSRIITEDAAAGSVFSRANADYDDDGAITLIDLRTLLCRISEAESAE